MAKQMKAATKTTARKVSGSKALVPTSGVRVTASEMLDKYATPQLVEKIMTDFMMHGDLANFSPSEQAIVYYRMCDRLGLDPFTKPFDLVPSAGRLRLYANKSLATQLAERHKVSVVNASKDYINDVFTVSILVRDQEGRQGYGTGAETIGGLSGDDLANMLMKAETKAFRRAVLTLYGLGLLDETEIGTLPGHPVPQPFELVGIPEEAKQSVKRRAVAKKAKAEAKPKPKYGLKLNPNKLKTAKGGK